MTSASDTSESNKLYRLLTAALFFLALPNRKYTKYEADFLVWRCSFFSSSVAFLRQVDQFLCRLTCLLKELEQSWVRWVVGSSSSNFLPCLSEIIDISRGVVVCNCSVFVKTRTIMILFKRQVISGIRIDAKWAPLIPGFASTSLRKRSNLAITNFSLCMAIALF